MLEDFADVVSRGALGWDTFDGSDQGAKFARRNILAEIRSRRLGNALFHQRAAEIVRSRLQARQGLLKSKLDPGDLNVGDVAVQKHAGERVNDQILVLRASCAGASG